MKYNILTKCQYIFRNFLIFIGIISTPIWADPLLNNTFVTIQQKSSMRYLDAHEYAKKDYRLVTRNNQRNKTQVWHIKPLGYNNLYTLQQVSNKRYMDAHVTENKDFGLVTRTAQHNNTQRWIIKRVYNNVYRIQQQVNGRYMDAHVNKNRDYEVVTRDFQNNDTQLWIIKSKRPMKPDKNPSNKVKHINIPISIISTLIKNQLNGLRIHLNNYGQRRGSSWYVGNSSYIKMPRTLGGNTYKFSIDPINKFPFRYYINDVNLDFFNVSSSQNKFKITFNFEDRGTEIKGHCASKGVKNALCINGPDGSAPDIQMNRAKAIVYLTPSIRNNSVSYSTIKTYFNANITIGKTCKSLGGLCDIFNYKTLIKNRIKTNMKKLLDNNNLRNQIADALYSELKKRGVKRIISVNIRGNMLVVRYRL